MALCLGLPGWAGTRRNIHPLKPILIINHHLSASSIYCDPWHSLCSIYVLESLFVQPLSIGYNWMPHIHPENCPFPSMISVAAHTHTHTHNYFTALWTLSGTTRVSWYQKVHLAIFWIFWCKYSCIEFLNYVCSDIFTFVLHDPFCDAVAI